MFFHPSHASSSFSRHGSVQMLEGSAFIKIHHCCNHHNSPLVQEEHIPINSPSPEYQDTPTPHIHIPGGSSFFCSSYDPNVICDGSQFSRFSRRIEASLSQARRWQNGDKDLVACPKPLSYDTTALTWLYPTTLKDSLSDLIFRVCLLGNGSTSFIVSSSMKNESRIQFLLLKKIVLSG